MSYLKGKDIKVQGDCLVYCYTRRIETVVNGCISYHIDGYEIQENWVNRYNKPEGFEKW